MSNVLVLLSPLAECRPDDVTLTSFGHQCDVTVATLIDL